MRFRYIAILSICFVFILFAWFYEIVFCGVYTNTGDMWIYASVTTFVLAIVGLQMVLIPVFFILVRWFSYSNKKMR
jgi:hypothetical protein